MSFDLDKFLLIDKAKIQSAAGQETGILTALRWCGIGGQIAPKIGGNWYLKHDIRDNNGIIIIPANYYAPLQYWKDREITDSDIAPRDFESPHEAMVREFKEETGYEVKWHRWHCFFIKEYQHAKIYMFVSFCSPDEMIKIQQQFPDGIGPEGQIQIHNVIDLFFDPELYTFDLPYIMNMIVRESRRGFITKLDPEGVNTRARQPK